MGRVIVRVLTWLPEKLGLARLPFLFQVIIIVIVAIGALGLQGMVGRRIIGNMLESTKRVFVEGFNAYADLATIKINLNEIRNVYLKEIGQSRPTSADVSTMTHALSRLDVDTDTRQKLEQIWEGILKICQAPPTTERYRELERQILLIRMEIDHLLQMTYTDCTKVMASSNAYSGQAAGTTLVITIVAGALSLGIGLSIAASIGQPLHSVAQAAQALGAGDLTPIVKETGSKETARVVRGFNSAIQGLRRLVHAIEEQAALTLRASAELKTSAAEAGVSAGQVARSIEELAKASAEQAKQAGLAVETVNRLSELVNKVWAETEAIATASEQVAATTQLGQAATDEVDREIDRLHKTTGEVATVITNLSQASTEIEEITSAIEAIAEQTTLLALNAQIEAARAGEAGRGFAVVADQTGRLAERSRQAAETIASMTEAMRERTRHAVTIINQAVERVDASRVRISEAYQTFQKIYEALTRNKEQIDDVLQYTRQMAKGNAEVTEVIATIAAISQENMANAQDVSSAAEEQSASTEQVATLAQELAQIAGDLQKATSVFTIEQEPAD